MSNVCRVQGLSIQGSSVVYPIQLHSQYAGLLTVECLKNYFALSIFCFVGND
jgi:hypothetical protein